MDILIAAYFETLRIDPAKPADEDRDRFILSKGHGAAALFQVLALRGFYPESMLDTYGEDGGVFAEHPPTPSDLPGIEAATGSLGHGFPMGLGYAELGPTHHSLEDLAILRALPDMTVFAPCDEVELRVGLRAALKQDGPMCMRIGKKGRTGDSRPGTNDAFMHEVGLQDYVRRLLETVHRKAVHDLRLLVSRPFEMLERDGTCYAGCNRGDDSNRRKEAKPCQVRDARRFPEEAGIKP